MVYLEKFIFPDKEHDTTNSQGNFYSDTYPFHLTSEMGLWSLDFEPVTIICGSNGSLTDCLCSTQAVISTRMLKYANIGLVIRLQEKQFIKDIGSLKNTIFPE